MNSFIISPVCRAQEAPCGEFNHTFGGQLDPPVIPPGGAAPCHLLYTIDTHDPLFPVRLSGARHLPLIYCPQYNAAAMGYRVTETGIVVDFIGSLEWASDFPYADYPSSFPRREIRLEEAASDVIELLEQYIDAHRPDSQDWDTVTDCEKKLKPHGYPFTQFGGRQMMWQDIPEVKCPNPACGRSRMDVFGVIWNVPVEGVYLWDDDPEYREVDDAQIIYQICPSCEAIHVCNRCT